MANITALDANTFEQTIKSSTQPVLVDFWAEWCGPCRMIAPVLEQIAQEREGQIKICKVDVDAHPQIAEKLLINSIPTLVIYRGGQEIGRKTGAYPKHLLDDYLNKVLAQQDQGL